VRFRLARRGIARAALVAVAIVTTLVSASCSEDDSDSTADGGAAGAFGCGDSPGAKCCTSGPECREGLACNAASVCEGCGEPDELCCDGACAAAGYTCHQGHCVACGIRGQPCCEGACTGGRLRCCGESEDPEVCEPPTATALCKACCATCSDGSSSQVDPGDGGCAAAAQAACAATVVCPDAGPCEPLLSYAWKTSCQ
jgi:hypothetical protein